MSAPAPKKVYIAGPAVFHADHGAAYFDTVRALLKEHGVIPMVPIDKVVVGALNIRNANIDMIKESDAIIADLSPFRSNEPDVGTCFEVGAGIALGKVVLTFTSDTRSMVAKYGSKTDKDGQSIEDFDLPFNLMLADGNPIFDSFKDAFEYYVKHHVV